MISIGSGANLWCNCRNKTHTSWDNNNNNNKVVVVCWKQRNRKKYSAGSDRVVTVVTSSSGIKLQARPAWTRTGGGGVVAVAASVVVVVTMIFSGTGVSAAKIEQNSDRLSNVPLTLSGEDSKKPRIQHPKSRNAERCTSKCVTTCIQGGAGSPGEGPINARRPLVVFKEGFRSRQYCLVECSDICNLMKDGDDGP